MPIYNTKCGIDVVFSGGEGTGYMEEYYFHNPFISDNKTVWIKDTTLIRMGHNVNNTAATNGRPREIVGTGIDGTGVGLIRYGFNRMWSRLGWSASLTNNVYSGYTGHFNIASQFYDVGIPIVGTTGGTTGGLNSSNPANKNSQTGFYWRAMIDSVGDEWHVFKYADDDYYDFPEAFSDASASDGKWFTMVVNPKTPCLTITSGTSGQFYTTPPYVYFVPKIHEQTTYFQGNCNFTLTDIYGNNVFYSINSGSYVNAGGPSVTLNQSNFNSGNNTLQYFYSGNSGYIKQRNIVKNPEFPSRNEVHGDLLWQNDTEFLKISGRLNRFPYSGGYSLFKNRNSSRLNQQNWDSYGNAGLRLGGSAGAWAANSSANNAFQAKVLGWNAICAGSTKSYANYAKEMCVENAWCTPNLGFELSMASLPQASPELNYRGYWDVDVIYDAVIGYDMLIKNYKNNQHPSGLTPIEDYFIRDKLADYVHFCSLWLYGHSDIGFPGMWGTARNVGATLIAQVLSTYSTPYYGTCGMDGNTTVYPWTPSQANNYTWKQIFVTGGSASSSGNYPLGLYPYSPVYAYGWEGINNSACLCNSSGIWTDRRAYAGDGQMGKHIGVYRNTQYMYAQDIDHSYMDLYLNKVTAGTAFYMKAEGGDTGVAPYGPFRLSSVGVLNERFPIFASNAQVYCKSLSSSDSESDAGGVSNLGIFGLSFYDDLYYGPSGTYNTGYMKLVRMGRFPRFSVYH